MILKDLAVARTQFLLAAQSADTSDPIEPTLGVPPAKD